MEYRKTTVYSMTSATLLAGRQRKGAKRMSYAARAIIMDGDNILVMRRNKKGVEYYTLVGGVVRNDEQPEAALKREVQEETGITITSARLVYTETHPKPYNSQYIYLCEATSSGPVEVQPDSEEKFLNRMDYDVHTPVWVQAKNFSKLPFSTIQLQKAITQALSSGFPEEPVNLS